MANATFFVEAPFTANKVGKTGLTVAFDVYEHNPATQTDNTSFLLAQPGVEVARGLYRLYFTGDEDRLYTAVGVTADTTVDTKEVPALGVLLARMGSLDADVSSRLAEAGYTAPDNAGVAAIQSKTDNLPASPAAVGSAMTLTAAYDAAKTAASQASVDDLPTNSELATALASADDAVLAAIAALNNLSSAGAQAAAAAALTAYGAALEASVQAIPLSLAQADIEAIGDYNWTRTPRTLTTPAQTAATQAEAGALEIVRGVTWNVTLSGVSFPATWVACLFTVKGTGYEDDADDSGALLQVRLSKPTVVTDGLLRLGGSAATAALGSITASEAGSTLALTLDDGATIELATRTGLTYDVKFLLADGSSVRERIGTLAVVATPTVTRG